ncbi:hypothetical protein [Porphyromonas pasteri]|uniref:Uncharacterized protein n=1 Tax=Porphyromonas pasteri TaxID=1583331 RepID=A0ABQ2H888_9PORP|nr:hypothetical protein [Porphyromonas pasteri]GGM55874.1 hypothetical protein GCM10007088_13410 [Porphyromonas pasteri]
MKIEIGESLAVSYLKHVKRCVIYQTNWKSSSQWDFLGEVKDASEAFERLVKDGLLSFQGKTKPSFSQFLKQAEIDILGINLFEKKMYVMDIAYHEDGLNYKNEDRTIKSFKKKLLRSYLLLRSYFPEDYKYEIIFASPKVRPKLNKELEDATEALNDLRDDVLSKGAVVFKYIANDKFKDKILDPTLEASKDDADTNELFLRSYKLLSMPYTKPQPGKRKADATD